MKCFSTRDTTVKHLLRPVLIDEILLEVKPLVQLRHENMFARLKPYLKIKERALCPEIR